MGHLSQKDTPSPPGLARKLPLFRVRSVALVLHLQGDMPETALMTLLLAGSLLAPAPAPAGAAVAPEALASPPHLVVVPGSSVFHAPRESYTLLAYAGGYYRLHRGAWFRSTGPGNTWRLIATDRVPNAVQAVLPTFAKVPAPSPTATASLAR